MGSAPVLPGVGCTVRCLQRSMQVPIGIQWTRAHLLRRRFLQLRPSFAASLRRTWLTLAALASSVGSRTPSTFAPSRAIIARDVTKAGARQCGLSKWLWRKGLGKSLCGRLQTRAANPSSQPRVNFAVCGQRIRPTPARRAPQKSSPGTPTTITAGSRARTAGGVGRAGATRAPPQGKQATRRSILRCTVAWHTAATTTGRTTLASATSSAPSTRTVATTSRRSVPQQVWLQRQLWRLPLQALASSRRLTRSATSV
mmetsp:Transcript_141570/g.394586  ORF Transcript_141570/g.394586 Transcript_141570/m.394586 type:complete len:256 (+) Transcript_141570:205-972(+)